MIDFVKGKIDFLDFDEAKSLDEFFDSFEKATMFLFDFSTISSTKVFHSWHEGHFPSHFGVS